MATGANLSDYNARLRCQAGKDWFDEGFLFTYTDPQGVVHNEDFSTCLGANMYFVPSGSVGATPIKYSTLNDPPELTLTQAVIDPPTPPIIAPTCLAAQNKLTEGNWDFALYTIDEIGAEQIQIIGVIEVDPAVGASNIP